LEAGGYLIPLALDLAAPFLELGDLGLEARELAPRHSAPGQPPAPCLRFGCVETGR